MSTFTVNLSDTLSFNIAGEEHVVKTTDLTPEALTGLLMYGRRKANDVFNSAKAGENPLTASEVIAKVVSWDFGTGGSRVSPLTKAMREIVKGYLVSTGMSAKDAATHAKVPQDGFRMALGFIIAKRDGVPVAKVDPAAVDEAYNGNWGKIETQAQAMVDATSGLDLDI